MQEKSDEQLMTAVMAGDQAALAALVARHHAPLLGYLYRLVGGDRPLAEDLVQETLLHVLRQRTWRPDRSFKPWLYAIATNLARDYFKSAAVRQRWREDDEEQALLQLSDNAPGPEERALAAEQGNEVRAALAQLREEYRVVVLLRLSVQVATALAYGCWLAFLAISSISNLQALLLSPALLVLPGCIGLALLAIALLRLHADMHHLLPHL